MKYFTTVIGTLLLTSTNVAALEITKEVCFEALGDLGLSTGGYELKKSWGSEKHTFSGNTECFERDKSVYIRSNNIVYAEDGFFGKTSLDARDKLLSIQRERKDSIKSDYSKAVALAKKERDIAISEMNDEIQIQLQQIQENDIPSSIATAMEADLVAKEEAEKARIAREENRARLKAKKIAAKKAEKEENNRKGFHCLSGFSGKQPFAVLALKPQLKDPKSFDHIETLVGPENNGRHTITIRYRANNSFGATVIGAAAGTYSNQNCEDVEITVIQ